MKSLNNKTNCPIDCRPGLSWSMGQYSFLKKATCQQCTWKPLFFRPTHGRTNELKCICYLNNITQDWELWRAETSNNTSAAPCAALHRVYDRAQYVWRDEYRWIVTKTCKIFRGQTTCYVWLVNISRGVILVQDLFCQPACILAPLKLMHWCTYSEIQLVQCMHTSNTVSLM